MLHDEMNVEIIEAGLCSWVSNMWKSDQPLVNIATGEEATKELVDNIQSTKGSGVKLSDAFCLRFTTNTQKETYFDKITKEPVMTFEKMNKTKEKKSPSVEEDEGKSFADIFMNFNEFKLDLSYSGQLQVNLGHFGQQVKQYQSANIFLKIRSKC